MSKRPNYKKGLGRNGTQSLKLQDFKDTFEWQLEDYGDSPKKTVFTTPLRDYYVLGIFCIKNKVSINSVVSNAINRQIELIKKNKLTVEKKGKNVFISELEVVNKKSEKIKTKSLFD